MTDMIDHPPHYNSSGIACECGCQIECIDITRHKNFNIGNVMKYIWRYEHKNGLEDLKKAAWYLNDEIKKLEDATAPANRLPTEKEFFVLNAIGKGLEQALAQKLSFSRGMAQAPCHACGKAHAGYTCEEYLTRSCHEHA